MTKLLDRLEDRWRALRGQPAFQASLVFAAGAWFVLQVADVLGLPLALVRGLAALLLLLFVALTAFALARTRTAGRSSAGTRRRGRAAVAVAVALLLVGTAAWWLRPRLVRASVVPGADVIAVLPFSATGEDAQALGEGLVDLLARNLDGVGGIRVIDPRAALYRWRQSGGDALDLSGVREVGRALGAGSILTGTAVEIGKELRLAAELVDVDGRTLAQAQVTGVVDSILPLVDRMSTDVLRRIWRAREPWPAFRLSAVTTESPDALRAYLRGEHFFRASQWDSAAASFQEAIHEDSTFALAYMRLGTSYGWTEVAGSQRPTEYAATALRLADRLPARERSLVSANLMHSRGDIRVLDSLERFVRAYPDDADGWELMADAELHSLVVTGKPLEYPLAAFDRAIALDSSATPTYMHPLFLTLLLDDSVRFDGYFAGFERNAAPEWVDVYRAQRALRWGPEDRVVAVFSTAARRASSPDLGKVTGLFFTGVNRAFFSPVPNPELAQELTDSSNVIFDLAQPPSPLRTVADARSEFRTLIGVGRYRDAAAQLDTMFTASPPSTIGSVLPWVIAGLAPSDFARRPLELLDTLPPGPGVTFFEAAVALSSGEVARARALLDSPAATDTVSEGVTLQPFLEALRAWASVAQGDTVGGLARLRASLMEIGYDQSYFLIRTPLLATLAKIQAAHPTTRSEGIDRLTVLLHLDQARQRRLELPLAHALEESGRTEEAKRAYERFIAAWSGADASVQPVVDSARQALNRLNDGG